MYCRNCGNIVADNTPSCPSCGYDPADGSNYCPKCGHFCIPGDVECVQCKASLVAPAKLSIRKEKSYYDAEPVQPQQPAQQPQPMQQPMQPPQQPMQPPQQPMQPPQQPPQQPMQPPQMGIPIPNMQQSQSQRPPQPQPQTQTQQSNVNTTIGPKFLSDNQRYCRNCGLVIPADAYKCPFCDASEGGNYCQKCGSGTTSADSVCSVCSSPLTLRPNVGYIPSPPPATRQNAQQQNRQQYTPPQNHRYGNTNYNNTNYNNGHYGNTQFGGGSMYGNTESRDWITTLLLCIFLGYFGVHRFYTKNYIAGIIQFFTGGLCCIWWLIDLILILSDGYTDGDGNKLKRN